MKLITAILVLFAFNVGICQKYETNNLMWYDSLGAKTEIFKIEERLQDGAAFEKLAEMYSQDPGSFEKGGVLNWKNPELYVKEFKNAVLSLAIGEVSKPFLTDFGYHIVQLLDKRGDEVLVRHILIRIRE